MVNKLKNLLVLCVFALVLAVGPAVAEDEEVSVPKTVYVEMKPSFVANFGEPATSKLSYVKADISLRAASDMVAQAIERHMPYLRNEIVMLLSAQKTENLTTTQGQEELRKTALDAINDVLEKEEGDTKVDDLLFTNFVVQN